MSVGTRAGLLVAHTRLDNTGIVGIVGRALTSVISYLSLNVLVIVVLCICILRSAF